MVAPANNSTPPVQLPIRPLPAPTSVVTPIATAGDGGNDDCKIKSVETGKDVMDCNEHFGSTKQQRARLSALIHQEGVTTSTDHSASKAMLSVWHHLSMVDRDSLLTVAETLSAANFSEYLPRLLNQKDVDGNLIITVKSTTGTSMIHELAALATSAIDPKLLPKLNQIGAAQGLIGGAKKTVTPADVLANTLDTIFHDDVIQGDSGTCASDSAEVIIETLNPAEYTRLVRETFGQGHTVVANGDSMKRNDDGIQTDGGLDMVNAVMQGTLMDLDEPNHFRWSPQTDKEGDHGSRDGKISVYNMAPSWLRTTMWCVPVLGWLAALVTALIQVKASDGTDEEHIAKTLSALTGKPYKVVSPFELDMPSSMAAKIALLKRLVPSGDARKSGIVACCYWSAGGHAMRLDGVDLKSSPPALICRTWNLRGMQKGEHVDGFDGNVTVEDPDRTTVRIALTDANPVRLGSLIVPEAMLAKK